MGTVYRPTYTKPLPAGARTLTRDGKPFAEWVDEAGKRRQAPMTGTTAKRPGIRVKATTYLAQYRDADGIERREPTGCRTLDAARAVLAELERRVEKVRAGVLTAAESTIADHADIPVVEHVDAYLAHMARKRGRGGRRNTSAGHVENVARDLAVVLPACGFRRLRDLNRDAVAVWVAGLLDLPDEPGVAADGTVVVPRRPSARTINAKLGTLTTFGNWLVETGRIVANPFDRLCKSAGVDGSDDIRRKRRALTADELRRLLVVARLRPVAEYGRGTIRVVDDTRPKSSRATWRKADLTFDTIVAAAARGRERLARRPDVLDRLERLGRERALLYLVLVTTGLRKGELASLTVADVVLDDARPVVMLRAADAKSGEAAVLPLTPEVVDALRHWLDERVEGVCRRGVGTAGFVSPRAGVPLFDVPDKLVRILDRDIIAAGIPKSDDRGRTVDVHALRGTFASHLARAGVAPVTLKTMMRHARIETTLKHYTDPRLLDVDSALDTLPALLAGPAPDAESMKATGTDDAVALVPLLVVEPGRAAPQQSVGDNCAGRGDCVVIDASPAPGTTSGGKAGKTEGWLTGLEPATPRITIGGNVVLTPASTRVTSSTPDACAAACAKSPADAPVVPAPGSPDRLDIVARAVALVASMPLSDADRAGVLDRVIEQLSIAAYPA